MLEGLSKEKLRIEGLSMEIDIHRWNASVPRNSVINDEFIECSVFFGVS